MNPRIVRLTRRKDAIVSAALWLLLIGTAAHGANNPVPFVNQPLVPDAVAPGSGGFTLTVNGTAFVQGATVYWNGSPRATTFVSEGQLTAAITAADVAVSRTTHVTVLNPAPGGGQSNWVPFEVVPPLPSMFFSTTGSPELGGQPGLPTAADLNGDGRLDLAVPGPGDFVSILLGNGDGTFQAPQSYATGLAPGWVATGDFNGDGKLDLAVSNYSSDSVSILLGKGDGTFRPQTQYSVGNGPTYMSVGDLNRDGYLDLLVADYLSNTSTVLFGVGDGTFTSGPALPTAWTGPLADLNDDGILDVAGFSTSGGVDNICAALGNGDGTFETPWCFYLGDQGTSATVADFNGDGKQDLAVSAGGGLHQEYGLIYILLGNGDGTFQSPGSGLTAGTVNSYSIAAQDFNGDGKLDLAVVNVGSSNFSIFLGNGDGTFQPQFTQPASKQPYLMTVGDFNNDGRPDIVTASESSTSLYVTLQTTAFLSPLAVVFSQQTLGTASPDQIVTLTNNATKTLTLSGITLGGADSGDFLESNKCPKSLAPASSCPISVIFRPLTHGALTASLNVSDNAPASPQSIPLTGTGTSFAISPSSLSFGGVIVGEKSAPQNVTLTNKSGGSQSVMAIRIHGGLAKDFTETNDCGSSLGAGESCTITVTFAPVVKGIANSDLQVEGGGGGPLLVKLSGTGT